MVVFSQITDGGDRCTKLPADGGNRCTMLPTDNSDRSNQIPEGGIQPLAAKCSSMVVSSHIHPVAAVMVVFNHMQPVVATDGPHMKTTEGPHMVMTTDLGGGNYFINTISCFLKNM